MLFFFRLDKTPTPATYNFKVANRDQFDVLNFGRKDKVSEHYFVKIFWILLTIFFSLFNDLCGISVILHFASDIILNLGINHWSKKVHTIMTSNIGSVPNFGG